MQDECDDVRLLAVWALGERRERAAQELLKDVLLDTNLAIQDAAIWALEQLAKRASAPDDDSLDNPAASPQAIENRPEDELEEENRFAKDLFLSLVDFVKGKKGFIKAETRGERVLILKCYYQKDDESLQEAVLKHKQGAFFIQHLENALFENDEMVQDLARHALRKRERRRWTETFLVSFNLAQRNGQYLIDDIPTRIIVCSIAYHQVRDDDVSICRSIDQYVKENSGRLIYERASEWLGRCKEPIFRYARGVSGIKVWYDCVTSPAHT